MKIGILSMQRITNYGSFLQAYALKRIIENLGHTVEFVDYRVEPVVVKGTREYLKRIKNKVKDYMLGIFLDHDFLYMAAPERIKTALQFHKRYAVEFLPLLGIDKRRNYQARVDTLVIGSDEVFNCLQTNPKVGYSKELFGFDNNAKKMVSYAASFGNTTLKGLRKYEIADEIGEMLSGFSTISVRDKNSKDIITDLLGVVPKCHLDPVLIHDFSTDLPKETPEKNYIVIYAYRGRLKDSELTAIKEFAETKGKKIICLGGYQSACVDFIEASPFEVLNYIKHADYVFTDTFHGSIFSIIFHKQFVIFVRESHNHSYGNYEKLSDLLCRLHLEQRRVLDLEDFFSLMDQPINYDIVDKIIAQEREHTIQYLKENL